jgi:hypothetical protein
MVLCSVCDKHVRKDRWAKHVEKVHSPKPRVVTEAKKTSERPGKKVTRGRRAVEQVREEIRRIDRHLKMLIPGFHRVRMEELRERRTSLVEELREAKAPSGSVSARRRASAGAGGSLASIEPHQQDDLLKSRGEEGSYGDKYLGQVRRDYDGSFGSIPLYDDYGEESFPERRSGDFRRRQ